MPDVFCFEVNKMRNFDKSNKLDGVCYDVRGAVMDYAYEMIENGIDIIKLNIGNPAPFKFSAPDEIIEDFIYILRDSECYSES